MAFSFKETPNVINIEIESKKYPVKLTRELGKRLSQFASDNDGDDAVSCIDALIDEILGKGKSAEIFEDREKDEFERFEVLKYICGELAKAADNLKRSISK